MSYPWYSIDGDMNMCYLYMQELKSCHDTKIYPQTNCKNEAEDFIECHSRQKHVLLPLTIEKRLLQVPEGPQPGPQRQRAPLRQQNRLLHLRRWQGHLQHRRRLQNLQVVLMPVISIDRLSTLFIPNIIMQHQKPIVCSLWATRPTICSGLNLLEGISASCAAALMLTFMEKSRGLLLQSTDLISRYVSSLSTILQFSLRLFLRTEIVWGRRLP